MSRPENLKYTDSDEWALAEGDVVTIGLTDHAVDQLGDLAFVDLPEPGLEVAAGDPFGEIESTKAASELFSPLSGEIVEVNAEVEEALHRITESPYQKGWLVKIRMSAPAEYEALMSASEYAANIEAREL